MREYDEAVRLHNYDKFNPSGYPGGVTGGGGGGGGGTEGRVKGGGGRNMTGDLSRTQEMELAQFLHQRDAVKLFIIISSLQGFFYFPESFWNCEQ